MKEDGNLIIGFHLSRLIACMHVPLEGGIGSFEGMG